MGSHRSVVVMGRPPFQLVRIISTESELKTRNFISVVWAGEVRWVVFMVWFCEFCKFGLLCLYRLGFCVGRPVLCGSSVLCAFFLHLISASPA
jgi:hypothetical protein